MANFHSEAVAKLHKMIESSIMNGIVLARIANVKCGKFLNEHGVYRV